MNDVILYIVEKSIDMLEKFGFVSGFFLIVLESIVPVLPLGLFVAFNFSAYGMVPGFVLSYLSTIVGCILAYYLSDKLFGMYVKKKMDELVQFKKIVLMLKKIELPKLVLIMALPFSPAFLINIAAGIIKLDIKKFVASLFIAKVSIVYFWGLVGKSFIDSIGDFRTMVIICVSLIVSYILSKVVSKKLKIE